jgi:chemotaxis receptor (MCP) glutamine deamidase CheD
MDAPPASCDDAPAFHDSHVIQGEQAVSDRADTTLQTVLGSCVAACLHDPVRRIGGMNHFLLPDDGHGADMRYASAAMERLVNELLKNGAERGRLQAKLFGGARIMSNLPDIGRRNAESALAFLQKRGHSLQIPEPRRQSGAPGPVLARHGPRPAIADRTARCRREPGDRRRTPESTGRIGGAFLTHDRAAPNRRSKTCLTVSKPEPRREAALVAGLSMALMATVMIFAILELSYEKAREAAELQASTALRVFEEGLAGNSEAIRFGQPMDGHYTATTLGRDPLRVFAGRPRPDQRCHRRAADLLHL